jgi:hypothetical protein
MRGTSTEIKADGWAGNSKSAAWLDARRSTELGGVTSEQKEAGKTKENIQHNNPVNTRVP